ncbi:immunoglobulin-like domain-containing protein [Corallococcus sp. 4LFB]|uniref:immunoglobulin-like domain-containing protein n=1 Tax=Corallococcus sp. 4LFB TaxID=3383249 RepID=UPI003975340C
MALGLWVTACGAPTAEESAQATTGGASPVEAAPHEEALPGTRPPGFKPEARQLRQERVSASALNVLKVTESGFITLSIDGLGTNGPSGVVQADKPSAGATVRRAYLAAASTGFSGYRLGNTDVRIDSQAVAWSTSIANSISSWNHWADVTSLVKGKLDAAPAGRVSFTISEAATSRVEGEVLTVIFDNPSETTVNTAILLFGAQNTTGDTFNISLSEPLNKNDPKLALDLSLGISYGSQIGSLNEQQRSTVDVNSQRLTSVAGGQDDGASANGALLTVGGLDDTNDNPSPFVTGPGPRIDDELYNVLPFVSHGATQIAINTFNASNDDNIFFAALSLRSAVAIVGEGIVLGPTLATSDVGQSHTVTATLQDDLGRPLVNRMVSFLINAGPNAGRTGQAATDSTGHASFTYVGSGGVGRDQVQSSFVKNSGEVALSNLALKDWTQTKRPPTAVCRDLVLDAGATCGVSGNVNNGSSDPDGDLVGCTQSPAGPFGLGTTSVTLTCVDQTGLSSSCTASVRVVDSSAPVLSCPANQQAECVGGGANVDTGRASASDNCGTPSVNSPSPAFYPLGTHVVTHTATDSSGNGASCTSAVVVRDTQAPVVTPNPVTATLECNVGTYHEAGATAADACVGNLSGAVVASSTVDTSRPGSYTVHYGVTDPSGNAASASRTVSVQDTLAPTVALVGSASQSLECNGGAYADPGATASDVCAGDLTASLVRSGSVDVGTVGVYNIGYTATDGVGLSASANREVTVVDTQAPSIVCPGPLIVEAPSSEGAVVTPAAAHATDACAVASVTGPPTQLYAPGATPVTYTATDFGGQSVSCGSTIYVTDPSASPPDMTMCNMPRYTRDEQLKACGYILPGPSGAPIIFAYFTVNDGAPIPVEPEVAGGHAVHFLTLEEGTYTIVLTAIDAQGGVVSQTRLVTVDRTAPAIRILSPLPDEAQPSVWVDITSEVTDASPSTVSTNWVEQSSVGEGTNTVTHSVRVADTGYNDVIITATDAAGNTGEFIGRVYVSE